jgi:YVTN family beta-propeller protein
VTQINPSTGQRVNTIPLGEGGTSESPGALAAAGSSVWVIDELSSTLWRIDTGTQRQAGSVSLQGRPSGIAIASDGGVWVSMATSNLVARVDPETGQSVTIDVIGGPTALTIGEGAVWVASFGGDQVSKIDLSTREVVASIPVGAVPSAVVVGAGSVWVAAAPN